MHFDTKNVISVNRRTLRHVFYSFCPLNPFFYTRDTSFTRFGHTVNPDWPRSRFGNDCVQGVPRVGDNSGDSGGDSGVCEYGRLTGLLTGFTGFYRIYGILRDLA